MIRSATGSEFKVKEPPKLFGACAALFVLAKPGIVAALTLSGFTGLVLAGRGFPDPRIGFSCAGSMFLAAAGSALFNSILERRQDRRMERLAARCTALVRIGTGPALAAAITLNSAGIALALAQLSGKAVLLLIAASVSYALCYTLFLKRHTPWAAVLGGLPGALPVLIGGAAVSIQPDPAVLALFLIMLIWQPPHFWLLSLSHREEYRAAGVPVLPLVKGDRFTKAGIFSGILALLPASLLLWLSGPCSSRYAVAAFLLWMSYLLACRHYLSPKQKYHYRAGFRCSILYLLLLFAIIIADLTVCVGS